MTEYYVWLQYCLGEGSVKGYNIIKDYGSAKGFYDSLQAGLCAVKYLTPNELSRLKRYNLDTAAVIINACVKKSIDILTIDNLSYPERLKNIYAPPLVLYTKGVLPDFDHLVTIGVVGNRKLSEYGKRVSQQIGYDLAKAGAIVVSGMALGVDTASHKGALKAGGKTVAVLGCGLDIAYPPENLELMGLIEISGTLISEYPPGAEPIGRNFPIRNRIISGLSNGIAVIEAGMKSGSLITANLALEQGRDIFTIPNSIYCENSAGSLRLLRDGAIPVGSAYDILLEYVGLYKDKLNIEGIPMRYYGENKFDEQPKKPAVAKGKTTKDEIVQMKLICEEEDPPKEEKSTSKPQTLPEYLTKEAKKVYTILNSNKQHIDEIATKTSLSTSQVLAAITELEIEELVRAHPGRRYTI